MNHVETDSRGEWYRSTYFCEACYQNYTRLVTYKIQSDSIESDEWEDLPEKDPMFEVEQEVFYLCGGKVAEGTVTSRHVEERGTYHYHVDGNGISNPDFYFDEGVLYPSQEEAEVALTK